MAESDPVDALDPLDALGDQIRSATGAAERFVQEAQRRRDGQSCREEQSTPPAARTEPSAGGIPSAGWEPTRQEATSELQALVGLLATLRELLPTDLQEQATALVRQLLVLLRSVIDWAVVQIDSGVRGQEHEIEEIPIG